MFRKRRYHRCVGCKWSSWRWLRKHGRPSSEYWREIMKQEGKDRLPWRWCIVPVAAGSGIVDPRGSIILKGSGVRCFYYDDFPEKHLDAGCPYYWPKRKAKAGC